MHRSSLQATDRMFDRHTLGVGGFVLIPLEMRAYLHPPQQTFPLSPFSGFTLSAGHKTIAPSQHRMAHVKHRPGEADILANTSHRRQIPLPPYIRKAVGSGPSLLPLTCVHACTACEMDAAAANVRRERDS